MDDGAGPCTDMGVYQHQVGTQLPKANITSLTITVINCTNASFKALCKCVDDINTVMLFCFSNY